MYDLPSDVRVNHSSSLLVLTLVQNGTHASWSSLVGIVTAIIGNVLISFALNTQRYAHIRIDREFNEGQEQRKTKKNLPKSMPGYGAAVQQEQIANERARLNAEAAGPGNDEDNETDAFGQSQKRDQSIGSDETARPHEKDGEDQSGRKSYLRSTYWWVGIILMTIGEAGNFLAYGFAPASIVSPLGVVALISNCLIAPFMLKERFRKRDFWGVVIAIGGAVTIVLSAKTSEVKMGPNDLWHAIKRWEFLTYIGITCVLIVLLMIASPRYGKRTILVDLGLVGLYGGYTALSTKGVASMLSGSLWKALTFPITYALVAVLVTSAIMQIRYINRALSTFDSTQVIPTQFVLFTLSVIIGSAVLYRDFEKTDAEHVVKFIAGCFLTFSGVWLITSGRKNQEEEDGDDGQHDETIQLIDEEVDMDNERTPLKQEHIRGVDTDSDRPKITQRQTIDDVVSARPLASETVPSLSITPSYDDTNQASWSASADNVNAMARPVTPLNPREFLDAQRTPYFTPSSAPNTGAQGRRGLMNRMESSPADPQTPSRASRAPSPPKADLPALVSGEAYQTPQSSIFRNARGSISRLLPGPFLGPLSSSSLNTVVAESLLKGEGSPLGPVRSRSYRSTRPAQPARSERDSRLSVNARSALEGADLESGLSSPSLSRWQTRESIQSTTNRRRNTGGSETAESSSRNNLAPSFSPTLSKFMSRLQERPNDPDSDVSESGPTSRNSNPDREEDEGGQVDRNKRKGGNNNV